MVTYNSIKDWKTQNITQYKNNIKELNLFHDQVMRKVLQVAIEKLDLGAPPCSFSWFVTGSGGRLEQGFISDQDHGLIFEENTVKCNDYFLALGEELSNGLAIVGYPYCKGNIMSSNPIWCKSIDAWEKQLLSWMESESFEAIRYLQIFFDARIIDGKVNFIGQLKSLIYDYHKKHPNLINRFLANIRHVKNVIGPFGQILVERYGTYQGFIDLKYSAFVPYVNVIRLLAIIEGLHETSTLCRINKLSQIPKYMNLLINCERNFDHLLKYRLELIEVENYTDTHYLNVERLEKQEKRNLKNILKTGIRLHDDVIELIEKGC